MKTKSQRRQCSTPILIWPASITACFKPLFASSTAVVAICNFFFENPCRLAEFEAPFSENPFPKIANIFDVLLSVLDGELPISWSGFGVLLARISSSVGGARFARISLIDSATLTAGLVAVKGDWIVLRGDFLGLNVVEDFVDTIFVGEYDP